MKSRITALLLVIFVLSACTNTKKRRIERESNTLSSEEMVETEGYGTVIGVVTVRGELHHTKGSLAQIDGMIVSGSEFSGEGSKLWTPEYEAMVGKTVEAKGEHYRYHCATHEQCLQGGVINYLREIEYIKLVE